MALRDFLRPDDIHLSLDGATKGAVLAELVASLGLTPEHSALLLRVLERRESLGSTGIGRGVAIPHSRTQLVDRLRIVFGRRLGGIEWNAMDGQPVSFVFLLVAPPVEVSNDYLPVLGRVAQLMHDPEVPARLARALAPAEVLQLLDEKSV
ncbi:MAG TPA: PTS sugar transporter subunit IIA [Gemmatimonadales bacterium]|jgi:mannitol/fructose-specific phosphotransferase system IIA component (Ntr-type)|nr:PTS sugar transporter subunit IIA [Gemmatimonadales bacterium]